MTIKMNLIDVKTDTYINFDTENNVKNPKFSVCDHWRLSKYKNILLKVTLQIGQKKY